MPNPGLSDAEIAQTIKAVESALREGYPPPGRSRPGTRSAIMRATELLREIERKPITESTLRSRLRTIKTRGVEPDWTLYEKPSFPASPPDPPRLDTPEAKLRFTIRQPRDNWGERYRVVVIFDAHDSPSIRKDRFLWMGRYVAETTPDMVVQIGDLFSFDSLCKIEPNDTLLGKSKPIFVDDIDSGHEALALFDKGTGGWDGEKHVTLGNHEARALTFTNRTPEIAGILTQNLDNLLMTHGWTYSPFGALHFIGGVAFTHILLSRLGRPYGGEHIENRIGNMALEDFVFGHTHRAVDKSFTKTGMNRNVRVISGGCSLEDGHVESYVGHAVSGWSYNIADMVIDEGRIRRCSLIPMSDLAERFG